MRIEYVVQVTIGGGDETYSGDADDPTHAIVSLDWRQLKRIRRLASEVKRLKIWRVSEFDYSPVFVQEADGGTLEPCPDFRPDGMTQNIDKDGINWVGSIKNTNIEIYVNSLDFSEIDENEMVLKAPANQLPLLIDKKKLHWKSSREFVLERLKGRKLPEVVRVYANQYQSGE